MKQIIIILSLILLGQHLNAQTEFKVLEEGRSMSKGHSNALVVQLPSSSYKQVNKLWAKYLKNFKGKTKYNRKTDEYFSDNATIKGMSENTVDITAKVYDKGTEGTELAVWFNLGATYLSSEAYPERFPSAEVLLKKFSLLVSSDLIQAQLKEEQKRLEEMNLALKVLEKEKKAEENNIVKQGENIVKAEASIKTSEKAIETNLGAQTSQKTDIKEQEKVIASIEKTLKELQK